MTATTAPTIKERPVLMHARSIRGILEGRKTQTRRLNGLDDVNECPNAWERVRVCALDYMTKRSAKGKFGATFTSHVGAIEPKTISICPAVCPYGHPGDRLWVRETFCYYDGQAFGYRADHEADYVPSTGWRSSIHMPRASCRLVLEITDIRVERVQSISEQDAKAEGIRLEELPYDPDNFHPPGSYGFVAGIGNPKTELIYRTPKEAFSTLWDDTNGKGAFERNDWVWVIEFRRCA